MERRIAILLALFAISLPLFAQKITGTYAGVLVTNGIAVDGAKVELRRGNVVVAQTTTRNGRYRMEAPAGRYQLFVDGTSAREVIVSAGSVSGEAEAPQFESTFDAVTLEQLPLESVVNAPFTLSPGSTRTSNYGGSIVDFYYDGQRSQTPFVPAEFVESTSRKDAAYGAEFGRATGGIIDVVTRNAINPLNATAFAYYRPWSDTFSRATAGVTLGGPIVRDRLFAFGGVARNRFEFRDSLTTFRNDVNVDDVLLKGDYLASPQANVVVAGNSTRGQRGITAGGSFVSGNTIVDATASVSDSKYFLDSNLVRAGVTHSIGDHVIRAGGEELRSEAGISSDTQSSPAFWLSDTWYAGRNVAVNGGVRREVVAGDTKWEPRLSVTWQPGKGAVRFAASHGTYDAEQQVRFAGVPAFKMTETAGEVALPQAGVAAHLIHREANIGQFGGGFANVDYDGAELEWSRRINATWFRASYVHGHYRSPFAGNGNDDSIKLIATTTIAKLDLGATALHESSMPFLFGNPAGGPFTRIDLRAGYRVLDSLTLIADALNITDDDSQYFSRRALQAGVRWRR